MISIKNKLWEDIHFMKSCNFTIYIIYGFIKFNYKL